MRRLIRSVSIPNSSAMSDHIAENMLRLMAAEGVSTRQIAERSGIDERTIRAVLGGTSKPHARTLHRLADGLAVSVDEFFLDPSQLLYRRLARRANPMVDEVARTHRKLFIGWAEADFDELHARTGANGTPTVEGTLAAVAEMNRIRKLHDKLDLLLESSQTELIGKVIDVVYKHVVHEHVVVEEE